jgi:murein DD-endopeptidase MepM/ murein hydrolase activator NlpD
VRQARAALRWDLALGARWSDVDRRLVDEALGRASALLAPLERRAAEEAPVLDWPVDPVHVTSPFGVRADPLGDGDERHVGVDLAAAEGQHVYAAGPGTVVFAAARGGYGLHVEIRHADGVLTRYAHLSELDVAEGARVQKGDSVGRAGHTGRATGPHLHFELWLDGVPVDPRDRLDGPPEARATRRR